MNEVATPWSRRIATGAVLVVAGALAIGSGSIPVAATLAAAVVLAGGLSLTATDSLRWRTIGSAIIAVGAVGAAGGVFVVGAVDGSSALSLAAAAGLLSVVAGLAVDRIDLGEGGLQQASLVSAGTGISLLVAGGLWRIFVSPSGGDVTVFGLVFGLHAPEPMTATVLWLLGVALLSLTAALVALPDVTILGPDGTEDDVAALSDLQQYLAIVGAVLTFAGIAMYALTGGHSPLPEGSLLWTAIAVVTTNTLLRGLLIGAIALGVALTVAGVALRLAWNSEENRRRVWGASLAGSALASGIVLGAASALAVGTGTTTLSVSVPAIAFVLGAGGVGLLAAAALFGMSLLFGSSSGQRWGAMSFAVTALTGVVGVVLATDAIIAPLIAVGATLVAWDVSTYGRGLADELGTAAPTSEGELAHAGGSAGVAAVGVVVAVVASFGLELISPLVASSGTTVGVAIGALAIVLGGILIALDGSN